MTILKLGVVPRTGLRRLGDPRRCRGGGAVVAALLAALASPPVALGQAVTPPTVADRAAAATSSPSGMTTREASLWITVEDRRGRSVVDQLAPRDLAATVGGEPADVLAIGETPLGSLRDRPAQVAIYFDRRAASVGALRRAAAALDDEARRLADLGEVSIIEAEATPLDLASSRDPYVLGEQLSRAALTLRGQHAVRTLREAAVAAVAALPTADRQRVATAVADAIAEEARILRDRADLLLGWAADQPAAPARILLLASEGHDLDPLAFWSGQLPEETLRAVVAELVERGGGELSFEPLAEEIGRTLSALGWIVVPLAIETPTAGRFRGAETVVRDPTGAEIDRSGGLATTPGRLFGDAERADAVLLMEPRRPLEVLATATGGELVTSSDAFGGALARLAERREVCLRARVPGDGEVVPLGISSRDDAWSVRAPRWLGDGTPLAVVASRLRSLLAGTERGAGDPELALTALIVSEARGVDRVQGTLELRIGEGLAISAATAERPLRLTIGSRTAGGELEIEHREIVVPPQADGEATSWRLPLEVPVDAQVAVLLTDPQDGRWGGVLAGVRYAAASLGEDLPTADVVELELPAGEVLRGRVRVSARPLDPRVARLLFMLDEQEVAEVDGAPWRVRIDLGPIPRSRRLEVIALDAAGEEIGRELALLNQGHGGLAVDIVRPRDPQGVGVVEVAAEVAVPRGGRLDRVLFYWDNELVATLFAPPFSQRILVPAERPVGYVRVVALLDDGTLAEDVLVMNGPQAGERVDVRLVEVYTVVTGRDGRPVSDLQREDFRIRENGELQEIATFRAAGDLPITLGLAIDSSSSMFVKLPHVQQAVTRFLTSAFDEGDRGFVVDFGSEPRLVRAMTHERDRLVEAVWSLQAGGRTALWESVVYSLVQLQGIAGRKALVVFSDGADEDDRFPFGSAIDVARRMGVPVYLIFMRREPEDGLGNLLGRSFADRVERLTDATGGRVFYAREYDDLGQVYDEIERELRSQYLIAYYPPDGTEAGWRDVDIEVTREGLVPRTLSGYYD